MWVQTKHNSFVASAERGRPQSLGARKLRRKFLICIHELLFLAIADPKGQRKIDAARIQSSATELAGRIVCRHKNKSRRSQACGSAISIRWLSNLAWWMDW